MLHYLITLFNLFLNNDHRNQNSPAKTHLRTPRTATPLTLSINSQNSINLAYWQSTKLYNDSKWLLTTWHINHRCTSNITSISHSYTVIPIISHARNRSYLGLYNLNMLTHQVISTKLFWTAYKQPHQYIIPNHTVKQINTFRIHKTTRLIPPNSSV